MIEYVVSGNIDDRILRRSAAILEGGGILAFPTDTSWSLACSHDSREGLKKLRLLSGERDERHFTLLCADISQFGEYCSLDNPRFRLVKRLSPGPYVFILKPLRGTEKALGLKRRELGVRIPGHPIPLALIRSLGKPLYSITAKRPHRGLQWVPRDEEVQGRPLGPTERRAALQCPPAIEDGEVEALSAIPEGDLFEGAWEIEELPGVDLILDSGEDQSRLFSTVLDLSGEDLQVLRSGAGPWPV
jgi:tRNA threonylcarbamoyl adenosine modification protein (Sua5/YciO/YrdC/YwlC family)